MDWKSKRVRKIIEAALVEDNAAHDITTKLTVDRNLRATATIIAKQPCVVAGIGAIPVIMETYFALAAKAGTTDLGSFEVVHHPEIFDGVHVKVGQPIAVIRANAAVLLSTERVTLNLLQRMSGIATLTSEFVAKVANLKSPIQTRILDTRKTIPGLRALDKYAVCCGGGVNHRLDLADGILIKNNHIALGGGLPKALRNAMKFRKGKQLVEVEVRTPTELTQAIAGKAESILLDNMTPAEVKKAVKLIRSALPAASIEASGNMSLATVRAYAEAGVNFISVGALTHSATAVDLSMRITADK